MYRRACARASRVPDCFLIIWVPGDGSCYFCRRAVLSSFLATVGGRAQGRGGRLPLCSGGRHRQGCVAGVRDRHTGSSRVISQHLVQRPGHRSQVRTVYPLVDVPGAVVFAGACRVGRAGESTLFQLARIWARLLTQDWPALTQCSRLAQIHVSQVLFSTDSDQPCVDA